MLCFKEVYTREGIFIEGFQVYTVHMKQEAEQVVC